MLNLTPSMMFCSGLPRRLLTLSLAVGCVLIWCSLGWTRGESQLTLKVVDQDTGQPVAVRMHLKDPRGKPVRAAGWPFWKDHFVFDGTLQLELKPGKYTYELERGPEYRLRSGFFVMRPGGYVDETVEMARFVDMATDGWWAGDLHVHREPRQVELLMRAEDLYVAPVITWWNDENTWRGRSLPEEPLVQFDNDRYYHLLAGEDERAGGALLYFNLPEPLPISGSQREHPSPVHFLKMARAQQQVHVDVEKPFWWDMPIWVASGMVDSLGLCHNHMQRDGVLDSEAWGKPRDTLFYPGPHGNGRWSWDIYYHLLNCGLQLPPSAGSASGVLPNPVGYNRVYVHCGPKLDYQQWWDGLRRGQVVVTNGPLMQVRANGQLPGHVFQADADQAVTLNIALNLRFRDQDRVEYLEIVKDGLVAHTVRLDEFAKEKGQLPEVTFDRSGWMLVRAVTNQQDTFRLAATGPFYVKIGGEPQISRKSAQFFVDWVYERARQLKLDDEQQQAEVLEHHRAARDYWQDLLDRANAP